MFGRHGFARFSVLYWLDGLTFDSERSHGATDILMAGARIDFSLHRREPCQQQVVRVDDNHMSGHDKGHDWAVKHDENWRWVMALVWATLFHDNRTMVQSAFAPSGCFLRSIVLDSLNSICR